MKSFNLADYATKYEYREDGTLLYKENCKTKKQGDEAGYIDACGYVRVSMAKNIKEYVHRIVWFIHTGEEAEYVDHINGCKHDNRIENLRSCTHAQNMRNRTTKTNRAHNLPRNVYLQKDGRFRVMLSIQGEIKHIGSYASIEEAAEQAEQARKEYYGEYSGQETTKDFC